MRNKIAGVVLCAALTSLALTGMAFAATGGFTEDKDGTVTYDEGAYTYTATYTDQAYAGKQAAIVVVRGTEQDDGTLSYTLSDKTITYIDQKAISDDGSISFTFIPRSQPDSLVLLGIEGTDAPVLVGKIIGQGVTVSGTVDFHGEATKANVTLKSADGAEYSIETAKGAYTIDGVSEGDYTLTIEKKGHLPYSKSVTIDADTLDLGSVTLLGGDVDTDSRYINFSDVSVMLSEFKKETAVSNSSNINEDNYVNFTDLSILLSNFKKTY